MKSLQKHKALRSSNIQDVVTNLYNIYLVGTSKRISPNMKRKLFVKCFSHLFNFVNSMKCDVFRISPLLLSKFLQLFIRANLLVVDTTFFIFGGSAYLTLFFLFIQCLDLSITISEILSPSTCFLKSIFVSTIGSL